MGDARDITIDLEEDRQRVIRSCTCSRDALEAKASGPLGDSLMFVGLWG